MLESIEVQVAESLTLRISASAKGLRGIQFDRPGTAAAPAEALSEAGASPNPLLAEAVSQLRAYFAGRLREFHLPLDLAGTDFQIQVWRQVQTVPYGQTCTYSAIAQAIGRPSAVRAVGAANGANPLPIVVPCHRVIGANGKLVGYGGGLPLKNRLLALERPDATLLPLPG
ncbi:MAG TPA: methylated-DNA--[protein]-cysteine S-methyltransferase [Bryobacteraceae bacterium]|nr:methylated-DNA--[protein]-cysteine S-methyltransferase [Bryobacteraceae bacterium]